MLKFRFFCFLVSANSLIAGSSVDRRITYPQVQDSSEENKRKFASSEINTDYFPETTLKPHSNGVITFRESKEEVKYAFSQEDNGLNSASKQTQNINNVRAISREKTVTERTIYPHSNNDENHKKSIQEAIAYNENMPDNSNMLYQRDSPNRTNLNSIRNNNENSYTSSSKATSTSSFGTKKNFDNQAASSTSILTGRGTTKNTRRNKKKRLCEEKYMEYMVRIFNDDDTVADGNDSDFDGRVLVEPGEYPHMVALGFTEPNQPIDYKCGGSLISESFVLTAAHCANLTGQIPKTVRIGDLNLMVEERYLEPQTRKISQIYTHPDYYSHLYYNDIALIELEYPVEFTEFVRPIRLWIDRELPVNITAHAMGYGATAFGKARTNRLTDMNLTIVANDICNSEMPEIAEAPMGIVSSQICAHDYLMNRDTCQGDSGGPLQLNLRGRRRRNRKHYHLIGITSYGLFCRSNYPSVYTRVSEFLDWIEQTVWLTQH